MNVAAGREESPEKVPERLTPIRTLSIDTKQAAKFVAMSKQEVFTPETKRVRSKSLHDIFAYGKNERWLIDPKELKSEPEPFAKGSFGELYRTRWRGT